MKDNRLVKVGIHGFGRIGRGVYRAALDYPNIQIVVVADLYDENTMFHLLQYDSIHGSLKNTIARTESGWSADESNTCYHQKVTPNEVIDWSQWEVDVVIESTGLFKS